MRARRKCDWFLDENELESNRDLRQRRHRGAARHRTRTPAARGPRGAHPAHRDRGQLLGHQRAQRRPLRHRPAGLAGDPGQRGRRDRRTGGRRSAGVQARGPRRLCRHGRAVLRRHGRIRARAQCAGAAPGAPARRHPGSPRGGTAPEGPDGVRHRAPLLPPGAGGRRPGPCGGQRRRQLAGAMVQASRRPGDRHRRFPREGGLRARPWLRPRHPVPRGRFRRGHAQAGAGGRRGGARWRGQGHVPAFLRLRETLRRPRQLRQCLGPGAALPR